MIIKNKKILVTGGAGFIGSHLVDKLAKENLVIVVDDLSLGTVENLKNAIATGNVRIEKENICNFARMNDLMKDVDIVFHLAAQCVRKSFRDPKEVHDVNAGGALSLYRAALANKIKRFIHVSSSEAYGSAITVPMREDHPLNPTTVYGASKLAGELYGIAYWRSYNFPVIVIRPFNTYGPRSHFEGPYGEVIPRFVIRALNNRSPIIFGDGNQTRDFTYVEDTVKGMIAAAKEDRLIGEVVNIAFGKERNINEVAKIILKELNREDIKILHRENRPADVRRHYADTTKAIKILNFKAKVPLEEGIVKYIKWLKEQKLDMKKALEKITERNWQ